MVLRGVLYFLAVAFSVALAGRFATVPDRIARLLVGMSAAWAMNALVLLALLIYSAATGDVDPSWRTGLLTVNAAMLAAAPLGLYALFPGDERK